jgi:hypothetical protein
VVFQEPGGWVARGLEHDIAAQGRTMDAAVAMLFSLVRAHVEFDRRHARQPLSVFAPAPELYWSAYSAGTPVQILPGKEPWGAVPVRRLAMAVTPVHPTYSQLVTRALTA